MTDAKRGALQRRPGGKLLADALVAQGVTHAFCVPGESYLDLLDGLYVQRNRIQLVTCRFEAGAVHMAEAYGKLTGRPGVAIVTRGPGACHAAIGVHVAFQDSTPLVLIVGQIPFEETDRESFQEVDYRKMFAPLAKWVTQIDDVARIPELMAHAFDVARSGRPGPVVVAISEEMQREQAALPDIGPARVLPPHPAPDAVPAMMEMLRRAQKPLAVLGGSGWSADGRAAIRDFLLANDLPVAVSFRRQSLFDGTSPNYRRRPRRRRGRRAGRQGQGMRPVPRPRHPHGRAGEPGLHPARHGRRRHADRAGLPGPGGDRPRVPPRARHRLRPERLRRGRARRRAGGEPALGRLDARAARGARGAGGGPRGARPGRPRPRLAGAGEDAAARHDLHHRRRQLRHLADALHACGRAAGVPRPDQRRHGLRRAGGDRRRDRASRTAA